MDRLFPLDICVPEIRSPAQDVLTGCGACPVRRGECHSPAMEPRGAGRRKLVVVGECPGEDEDAEGRPFVGRCGRFLDKVLLEECGLDSDKDCVVTNARQCFVKDGLSEADGRTAARCCRPRFVGQVKAVPPKLVLALGNDAIRSALPDIPGDPSVGRMRGRAAWSQEFGCRVFCSWHPSYILRSKDPAEEVLFRTDFRRARKVMDLPPPDLAGSNSVVLSADEAIGVLQEAVQSQVPIAFDLETTGLDPLVEDSAILTVNIALGPNRGYAIPIRHPQAGWTDGELGRIEDAVRDFLCSDVTKAVHNGGFEDAWCRRHFGVSIGRGPILDTLVVQHVLDERPGAKSLEFLAYCETGERYKLDRTRMGSYPLRQLGEYGAKDARMTYIVADRQSRRLAAEPELLSGVELFHDALPVLWKMAAVGIRVDAEKLRAFGESLRSEAKEAREVCLSLMGPEYRQKCGSEFNPDSPVQVAKALRELCGHTTTERTPTGLDSTTDAVLDRITSEEPASVAGQLAVQVLTIRRAVKLAGTYVDGILDKIDCEGRVHPSISLSVAESYRSSCENPNFQNLPKRDKDSLPVRRAVIPSDGMVLLEGDYKGSELRGLAIYSRDRNLTRVIMEGQDIHRHWAARIFGIPEADVTDEQRSAKGKSGFVFPLFYGSQADNVAADLQIPRPFVRKLVAEFWDMFPQVLDWQRAVYEQYCRLGYVRLVSGFRRSAPLTRRQVTNTPIQGTSFHLLLRGMIRLARWLRERRMRSRLLLEVHDSVLLECPPDEVEAVTTEGSKRLGGIMYPWQNGIPMEVEWKVGPNWADMEAV